MYVLYLDVHIVRRTSNVYHCMLITGTVMSCNVLEITYCWQWEDEYCTVIGIANNLQSAVGSHVSMCGVNRCITAPPLSPHSLPVGILYPQTYFFVPGPSLPVCTTLQTIRTQSCERSMHMMCVPKNWLQHTRSCRVRECIPA